MNADRRVSEAYEKKYGRALYLDVTPEPIRGVREANALMDELEGRANDVRSEIVRRAAAAGLDPLLVAKSPTHLLRDMLGAA